MNTFEDSVLVRLVRKYERQMYFMGIYELIYGKQPIENPEENKIWLSNFREWYEKI